MAGLFEGSFVEQKDIVARYIREFFASFKSKEFSLYLYLCFFIAFNVANVTLLSSSGWTIYEPYNPEPADDAVINDNSPKVSATYRDEDGDPGTLYFFDNSDSSIGSCGVDNGSRCGVEWEDASAHDNYWYSIAEDDEGDTAEGPSWYFLINNPPDTVSSPDNPPDGTTIYDDSVDLEVSVSDPDGDDMTVEFLNNVSNASESERTNYGVSDGSQTSVNLDLDQGRSYKWWVSVRDNWDKTVSGPWTFYVNEPPKLTSVEPSHDEVHTSDKILLNVTASDGEQDELYAYFYDGEGNFLGKDSGGEEEKLGSDRWTELEIGRTYDWKVNISDSYENDTYRFSFLRLATEEYRVEQGLDYEYSGIITSPDSSKILLVEVENKVSTSKDMITYLEGVNAYFNENDQSSYSYTLEGYETKDFLVTVKPESESDSELSVVTEDTLIGVNTTSSLPVMVRETPATASKREVPGIAMIQLIVIMLLSVLLYYQQL